MVKNYINELVNPIVLMVIVMDMGIIIIMVLGI
jgi:hypothetical protein